MKISITPGRYTTLILKEVNNQKAGRRVAEHLRILHRIGPSTKGSTNTTRGQDSRGKSQDQMKPQGLVTMKISITRGRYTTLIPKEVDNQKAGRRVGACSHPTQDRTSDQRFNQYNQRIRPVNQGRDRG
jgi:hypothetical protein